MKKPIYKSKTLWGFGLTALVAIGQVFNVSINESLLAQLVQVLTALFGVYGLRDSQK